MIDFMYTNDLNKILLQIIKEYTQAPVDFKFSVRP